MQTAAAPVLSPFDAAGRANGLAAAARVLAHDEHVRARAASRDAAKLAYFDRAELLAPLTEAEQRLRSLILRDRLAA